MMNTTIMIKMVIKMVADAVRHICMGGFTLCETHLAKTKRIKNIDKQWQAQSTHERWGENISGFRWMCAVGWAKHTATDTPTMMKEKVDNESHIDTTMKKCIMHRHVSYCTDMLVIVAACIHGATPVRAAVWLYAPLCHFRSPACELCHLLPTFVIFWQLLYEFP